MVTRRVSEESLEAAKSSLTRRVTNRLLRYAAKFQRVTIRDEPTASALSLKDA